jgi:molybdate transport system substrate-binding protein
MLPRDHRMGSPVVRDIAAGDRPASAYDCAVPTRATVGLTLLLLASCTSAETPENELHVFAAASLSDAFSAIAGRFEEDHDSVEVKLNFLSSSELAQQIEQGAPADVFASADTKTMIGLQALDLVVGDSKVFATNHMALVVEKGNPLGIDELGDLADPELVISLAAPGVPAGDYAREVLSAAQVKVSVDSEEQDVRAVVTRVATGEADAGIVYESDAMTSLNVDIIPIPEQFNVVARYPIAVVADGDDGELAQEFVSLVVSEAGTQVLIDHGFRKP